MAYIIDDDETRMQELKDKIEALELQTISGSISGRNISTRHTGIQTSTGGTLVTTQNLGDLSGIFNVDFNRFDTKQLFGNQVGQDVSLTFSNIPVNLSLNLKIYLTPADVNGSLIIGGNVIYDAGSDPFNVKPLATNDFLSIEVESPDQLNINIISVKKNDEGDIAPGIPENITISGHTDTSIDVSWEPPLLGSLPLTYDVEYSLSPAETGGVPDTPINDPSTKDLTDLKVTVTGLTAATTYYFWVRAKNPIGESVFVGPIQTITDGSYSPGDVGFTLVTLDFNTIRASWTQPVGKALRFTLKRDLGGGITETVVDDDVPAPLATNTYDDDLLDPETLYDYIFEVRNEFGSLISTINASATTDPIPIPVVVFTTIERKLKFTVTLPAGINVAEVEWSLENTVGIDGEFIGQGTGSRQINRPLGVSGQTDVIFEIENTANTLFYGHARLIHNQISGDFSVTTTATTGTLSTPQKPNLSVTSPATGQIRIKVTYANSTTQDEIAVVSWRLASSVQEYFDTIYDVGTTTIANSYSRNSPPTDDLNAAENRVEVIREGAFNPGDSITVRCVCVNAVGTSIADTDNVLVDN